MKSVRRAPNGMGSVRQDKATGTWHGYVSLGDRPDGSRRRKHVRGPDKETVRREMLRLLGDVAPTDPAAARSVASWMVEWLDEVQRTRKPSTFASYETYVRRFIIPGVGKVRLDKLTDAQVLSVVTTPAGAESRRACLKTFSVALNEAWRKHLVTENAAARVRLDRPAPRFEDEESEPVLGSTSTGHRRVRALSPEETAALIRTALTQRSGVRWVLALALGLRQSETLGVCWRDIDWEERTITIRRSYIRRSYRHGCRDPQLCCTQPSRCPQRERQGQIDVTKSKAGDRVLSLGAGLLALLREHRRSQAEERLAYGVPRNSWDWVFTGLDGKPVQHDVDRRAWKALLKAAGLDAQIRLHDLRHSAATQLLVLGTDSRTVMDLMGWSTPRMAAVYQHVVDDVKRNIADRLDEKLGLGGGTSS